MFFICSHLIRLEKESKMAQKLIAALLAVAGLATAAPAVAQDYGTVSAPPPNPASGYHIENSEAGFQLVTHGVWRSPDALLPSERGLAATVSSPPRATSRQGSKRPQGAAPNFRRAAYLPHVYAAEAQYGLPTGLLDALIWTESRYNPLAVSGAGAAGLGQLMPGTARELGVFNRFDPRANVWAAARYLRQMLDKFGMVHLAIAAYNAGPGAVERAGGIPLNGETPSYVRNVLAFWGAR
jgi:soluble lytic murein transglycosylase-like protein